MLRNVRRPRRARPLFRLIVASLLGALAALPASAWTIRELPPTNFELIRSAEILVIAQLAGFEGDGSDCCGSAVLETIEILRGDFTDSRFRIYSNRQHFGSAERPRFPVESIDEGTCLGHEMKEGALYLLVLARGNEHSIAAWGTPWLKNAQQCSPGTIELRDLNSPWARTVRRYSEVREAPNSAEENAAILELIRRSEAEPEDARYPKAMAEDLRHHLATPTRWKSSSRLVDMFRDPAASPAARKRALDSLADREEREGVTLALQLVRSETLAPEWVSAVSRIAAASGEPGLVDWLFASALTPRVDGTSGATIRALVSGKGERPLEAMLSVLRLASTQEALILVDWFVLHAPASALDEYRRRLAAALAANPRRDHDQLALALARLGDLTPLPLGWARDQPHAFDARTPYLALAYSPRTEADAEVARLVEISSLDALEIVVSGLSDTKSSRRDQRLTYLAESGPRDLAFRCTLRQTMVGIARTEPEPAGLEALLTKLDDDLRREARLPAGCLDGHALGARSR